MMTHQSQASKRLSQSMPDFIRPCVTAEDWLVGRDHVCCSAKQCGCSC